jgi:hypothetical protein
MHLSSVLNLEMTFIVVADRDGSYRMGNTLETDITTYSEKIPGDKRNYEWAVRFDNTGPADYAHEPGYIGITQFDEGGAAKERVLLSPKQMQALIEFARKIRRLD